MEIDIKNIPIAYKDSDRKEFIEDLVDEFRAWNSWWEYHDNGKMIATPPSKDKFIEELNSKFADKYNVVKN